MRLDFITKKEIRMYFPDEPSSQINKLFREVRVFSLKKGMSTFNKTALHTKIFCEYWGLDLETFKNVIKEEREKLND